MANTSNLKSFKPGQSGNPAGRRVGSRIKLSEAFLAALCEDFVQYGRETIERVRVEKPDAYLKVVASILPKQLEVTTDPFDGVSDDDLATIVAAATAALQQEGEDEHGATLQ